MIYDIVIVGGGPAGLTAAIYARRANKNVLVVERALYGGQVAVIGEIENYPGFLSIQGPELATTLHSQAKKLGAEFVHDNMLSLDVSGQIKRVVCKKGSYEARAVILALGSMSRELNVDGEKKYIGSGVSYCATCDGNFFKGKKVAVIGSGDSAVASALYLQPLASEVVIVSKYPQLKLKAYTPEIFKRLNKTSFMYSANVKSINGDEKVTSMTVATESGSLEVPVDGIFVTIGRKPDTHMLEGTLKLDKLGFIEVDEGMHTSQENVYACGDVATIKLKQIVTAVAGGAVAATEAIKNL